MLCHICEKSYGADSCKTYDLCVVYLELNAEWNPTELLWYHISYLAKFYYPSILTRKSWQANKKNYVTNLDWADDMLLVRRHRECWATNYSLAVSELLHIEFFRQKYVLLPTAQLVIFKFSFPQGTISFLVQHPLMKTYSHLLFIKRLFRFFQVQPEIGAHQIISLILKVPGSFLSTCTSHFSTIK